MSRIGFFAVLVASVALASIARAQSGLSASVDDTARFLAGMQVSPNSPLTQYAQEPSAKQHAAAFDTAFGNLEENQMSKVRAWSNINLTAPRPVMFYMFGGPDFLYADAFFPKATTYVLSGLEPVGPIPDLVKLPRWSVLQAQRQIQVSLRSILAYSFFQTAHMYQDLNSGPVYGTLPILYVFLARSGKTIHDVSLVHLDEQGALHDGNGVQPVSPARGLKIVFSENNGPKKILYYFSSNIADNRAKSLALLQFCRSLGKGDSFVKSASYLLHQSGFSQVRNFIVENSTQVLQDDTGVPIVHFDPVKWQLKPFGRYMGPIFAGYDQPKLSELSRKGPSNTIEFGIGYRWRANDSNLLLAIRDPNAPDVTSSVPQEGVAPPRTAEVETAGVTRRSYQASPGRQRDDVPFIYYPFTQHGPE